MLIRLKLLNPRLFLSMYSSELNSEDTLYLLFIEQPWLINQVPFRPPLSFPSYPIRKYNEDPNERITTRRDAPLRRSEDFSVKD